MERPELEEDPEDEQAPTRASSEEFTWQPGRSKRRMRRRKPAGQVGDKKRRAVLPNRDDHRLLSKSTHSSAVARRRRKLKKDLVAARSKSVEKIARDWRQYNWPPVSASLMYQVLVVTR